MKSFLELFTAMLLTAFLFITCFGAEGLNFADKEETPDCTIASGYPRFALRDDGTLIMTTDSRAICFSTDNGKTWTKAGREPTAAAASSVTTSTGTVHKLTKANLQPFVLPDGTILLAYRSHTANYSSGEFYSSIRVMTSDNGGKIFSGEKILTEIVTDSFRGFWEPFMIWLDEDTVGLYYADDATTFVKVQQKIAYITYTVSTGEWREPQTAIYRKVGMRSRDGMPTVTALRSGGFAMVAEVQDYANWMGEGYDSVFSVGLSLSSDGRVWSDPIPIIAPADLGAGIRCSAPSIATLPDGRVVITYQTDKGYSGSLGTGDYVRVCGAAISDGALTLDTPITATKGGAADGFTLLDGLFEYGENQYQIWNTVSCFGDDVYIAGSSGTNIEENKRTAHHVKLRRATVESLMGDINGDGAVDEKDAERALTLIGESAWNKDVYLGDIDGDGVIGLLDALMMVKK